MRSQPNCFEVVVVVVVVFVVVVILNVDVVDQATSKIDLMLLVMEVEFHGGWVVVCKVIFVSNPTQLRLSWGYDNLKQKIWSHF